MHGEAHEVHLCLQPKSRLKTEIETPIFWIQFTFMKNTTRDRALPCLIITLMLLSQRIHAENYQVPVKIGDKIPNVVLKNFKNKQGKDISIDSYKGKFLIIDFFATWCGTCVGSLVHLNELKSQYDDKVEILVVTRETKAVYDKAAAKFPNIKSNSLPVVFEDSLLNSLFPHRIIPHEIWVDDEGIVIAITNSNFVTANNVQKFLNKQKLDLPIKEDLQPYDKKLDLVENIAKTGVNVRKFVTTISDNIPGFESFLGQSIDSTTLTRYLINSTIFGFYSILIDPQYWGGKVLLDVKDKSRFVPVESDSLDWNTRNSYCYEIKVPKDYSEERIAKIMKNSIDNYFSLTTSIEEREVNCWGIIVENIDTLLKYSAATTVSGKKPQTVVYENISLAALAVELSEATSLQYKAPIYFDSSNYNGTINFEMSSLLLTSREGASDVKIIQKLLQSKGLNLIPIKRKMKVFVIKDTEL